MFRSLCFLILFGLPLNALDASKTLTQYAHRIWGQEEGLLQPTIYSILQTRSGFLWLGTQDSLIRFDGIHFREYDNAAQAGLQRSLIRSLAEDASGNLWVASVGSGVVRIAPDGTFERFSTKNGLPGDDTFCVVPAAGGAVWICTNRGLVRLDGEKARVYSTVDGLPSNQIRDTCLAADGVRWVAGLDFGVFRWDGRRFKPVALSTDPDLRGISTALSCATDGSVWVGTSDGVARFKDGAVHTLTTRNGLADDEVSALAQGNDGSVWIGTNDGISRYQNGEISTYPARDGLSHTLVLSLFMDREGSLWAGTKDGLDQFTDGKVTPYSTNEGLLSNEAGPLVEDNSGRLWIGTLGHGLNLYDGHHFRAITKRDGLLDDYIISLQLDAAGDLWVGSNRGLNRLHDGKVTGSFTQRDGLSGAQVRALAVDAQGVLWAGTNRGLDRLEGNRFRPAGFASPLGIVALSAGKSVRLFVSTDSAGFTYLPKDGPATTYALDVTHPVDSYYVDLARREAWMGTLGSGLLRWKNGAVTHVRVKDGLFDNRIYSVLRDDSANYWMASSKGIFRVSEKDLEDFSEGKIRYLTSIPFSTGQLRFECRSGVQPAACRTRDGRLWFSTTNGLVVLDPLHLASNAVPPPAQITSIVVNGQRRQPEQDLHLTPFERNLEVRYAGLSLVSPEKVTFRYMLDGYDKTWTDAGTRREAFFTNLPPGHFRFHVRARNADGIWSTQDASVAFAVDPRLYQRAWFFPLLALVLGGMIVALVRLRIARIKHRFDFILAERSRIARELHDTLLQGLSGITMQLQALWTRLPVSQERTLLAGIIEDAARCSAEARQSLWGLRATGAGSLEFSDKLAKLARDAAVPGGPQLSLKVIPLSLAASPEIEYQLLRIAQQAVSNALQHSQARKLEVQLRPTGTRTELLVSDDGIGFDLEQRDFGHFGLVGMRERAKEIGAELFVTSAAGQGTTVRVLLPKLELV